MKIPTLWLREQNKCFYVKLGGRQVNLGSDEDEAKKKYGRILAGEGYTEPDTHLTIAELVTDFLAWSAEEHEPDTTDRYSRFLSDFSKRYGRLRPCQIKQAVERNATFTRPARTSAACGS
jgi:hypothetical protein